MEEKSAPRDHVSDSFDHDDDSLEHNVKSRSTWLRLFFMCVMVLLYGVSRVVVAAVVVIQFFTLLFRGKTNEPLVDLGQSLATYTYQIVRYLTFNTEERPYPFDQEWPRERPEFQAKDANDAS
jgi:hypothetical protein